MSPGTKKPEEKEIPEVLRSEAERKLAKRSHPHPSFPVNTPEQLIHELQVHQIELEMQNEALREARLALEEARDRYIDLYEFAPVGYLTLTKDAVIEEANLTGASMLGVDRRKLIKDRFRRFVAPEEHESWDQYFIAVMRSNEKQTGSLQLLKGGGARFQARVESLKIDRKKKDPVFRMAIIDVSVQKHAEDALARKSEDMQTANEELTASGEELRRNEVCLTESLEEKEALLAEVHHRVKNNLAAFISLLALDGTYEESPTGQRLKTDLQNRARSMALIHETLYKTRKFSSVDMDVYLSTLTEQISGTYQTRKSLSILVDAKGISLDLSRATPTGLIVNELITNTFKYAFPASFDCETVRHEPCTLRVSLALVDGMYTLRVGDNGIGLPASFDTANATSLGLKLVNFLARHQLRAKIEIVTTKGTEYILRFSDKTKLPNSS